MTPVYLKVYHLQGSGRDLFSQPNWGVGVGGGGGVYAHECCLLLLLSKHVLVDIYKLPGNSIALHGMYTMFTCTMMFHNGSLSFHPKCDITKLSFPLP